MIRIRIGDRQLMNYKYYLKADHKDTYSLELVYICSALGGGVADVRNPPLIPA